MREADDDPEPGQRKSLLAFRVGDEIGGAELVVGAPAAPLIKLV